MARLKLYRKPGDKYRTELRPSRIDILVLPLLICFLSSIVVWCYVTGRNRPEPEPETSAVETSAPAEDASEPPAEGEAHPSDV